MRHIIAVVYLLFSTLPAHASETRMATLRHSPGITDETDVFVFPGAVTQYSLALIELGTAADTDVYAGALKRVDNQAFGAVVSRDASLMTYPQSGFSLTSDWLAKTASNTDGKAIIPAPERPIDLFYGMAFGNNSFGAHITYADFTNSSKTSDGPAVKKSATANQVDLGLGFSNKGPGDSHNDVGLNIGVTGNLQESVDNNGAVVKNSYKRGNSMDLAVRHTGSRTGAGSMYWATNFVTDSPEVSTDNGSGAKSAKFSDTGFGAEGGYVASLAKGATLVAAGVGFTDFTSKGPAIATGTGIGASGNAGQPSMATTDSKIKRVTDEIYASLSLETPIVESFGFLGGMEYLLWGTVKTDDDINTGKPRTETSVTETPDASLWALGLFYKHEAFRVDASFLKRFLHNGPFLLTGNATPSVFARISVTYQL